jgi:4-amino-4-deoxy-L-arabinose transferase-like glycosyltransferase
VRRTASLFGLFLVASLATRWISLIIDVIDIDETAHIVGAWEMLRGRVPYAEFVNNKPPLLYVYYALSQWLIGEGLWTVRLLTTTVTVPLTALGVSKYFDHSRTGVVAGLVLIVYGAAFLGHDMLSSNTEVLMLLPAAWALACVRDAGRAARPGWLLAAGTLVGLAALFRPQGVLFAPPIAVAVWVAGWSGEGGTPLRIWHRARATLVSTVALASGIAAPLALTWLAFARFGADDDLIYWVFTNNLGYAANPILAREAVERALSSFAPFLIVTCPLWWATWHALRREADPYRRVLAVSLVAFALPAALVGFRFYPHYFVQLYVPLAIASAPAVDRWTRRPMGPSGVRFVAWSATLLAGFTISTLVLYSGHAHVYREIDPVFGRVAARLAADDCHHGATLFVWGYAPMFYYHARLPAASRFVVLAQARLTGYVSGNLASVRGEQSVSGVVEPRHWDWLMEDLEARRATYILDTAPAGIFRWDRYPLADYPRLQRYVDERFELIDTIDRVRIYRRVGCR